MSAHQGVYGGVLSRGIAFFTSCITCNYSMNQEEAEQNTGLHHNPFTCTDLPPTYRPPDYPTDAVTYSDTRTTLATKADFEFFRNIGVDVSELCKAEVIPSVADLKPIQKQSSGYKIAAGVLGPEGGSLELYNTRSAIPPVTLDIPERRLSKNILIVVLYICKSEDDLTYASIFPKSYPVTGILNYPRENLVSNSVSNDGKWKYYQKKIDNL